MNREIPTVLVSSGSTEGNLELHNGSIIQVDSDAWFEWLRRNTSFRFVSGFAGENSFTARRHDRDSGEFWYAYRKLSGKLKNTYLGKTETLTIEKLLKAALKLSAHLEAAVKEVSSDNGYAKQCITEQLSTVDTYSQDAASELQQLRDRLLVLETENQDLKLQLKKLKSIEQDLLNQVIDCNSNAFKAADILKAALKLKSNSGGAIKQEIKKALPLIDDV